MSVHKEYASLMLICSIVYLYNYIIFWQIFVKRKRKNAQKIVRKIVINNKIIKLNKK